MDFSIKSQLLWLVGTISAKSNLLYWSKYKYAGEKFAAFEGLIRVNSINHMKNEVFQDKLPRLETSRLDGMNHEHNLRKLKKQQQKSHTSETENQTLYLC